jgi:2-amino-4-hydroxy-6-hydroxymethyldihydropteridine diphosphokinase
MNFTYLLLGSNLGDRPALLQFAKEEISSSIGIISKESSVYESEPWGFHSRHRFLNQVVRIETEYRPMDVLTEIFRIENKLGRIRTGKKGYISRRIDIDILFFNDEIISEDKLCIPHPKIPYRMFTLLPLSELDGSLIHPASGKSISELMNECTDRLSVYLYLPK